MILVSVCHKHRDRFGPGSSIRQFFHIVTRDAVNQVLVRIRVKVSRMSHDKIDNHFMNTVSSRPFDPFFRCRREFVNVESRKLRRVELAYIVCIIGIGVDAGDNPGTFGQPDFIVRLFTGKLHQGVQRDSHASVKFIEQQQNRFMMNHPLRRTHRRNVIDFLMLGAVLIVPNDRFLNLLRQSCNVAGVGRMRRVPDDKFQAETFG